MLQGLNQGDSMTLTFLPCKTNRPTGKRLVDKTHLWKKHTCGQNIPVNKTSCGQNIHVDKMSLDIRPSSWKSWVEKTLFALRPTTNIYTHNFTIFLNNKDTVANRGSQTIVAGRDRTRDLLITRKASWPLAQRGALFLVNPGVIEALHSDRYRTIHSNIFITIHSNMFRTIQSNMFKNSKRLFYTVSWKRCQRWTN